MEATSNRALRSGRRRRMEPSRPRNQRIPRKVEFAEQKTNDVVEPIELEEWENLDNNSNNRMQSMVLLHTPSNPLQVKFGMFLKREKLVSGYLISEYHEESRNREHVAEKVTRLVVTVEAKQVLEEFVDLDTLEIRKDLISSVFTVSFESILRCWIMEVPEDGSAFDTTRSFDGFFIARSTKININRSELCSMLVELKRREESSKPGVITILEASSNWRWPRLQKAKQDYTFLGLKNQNSTIFLAKLDAQGDYTFDEDKWETGSELYTESTSLKLGKKTVLTYSLRTLQGIVSVIFDSREVQLRFTRFLHTIISGTSDVRLIALWTYKLKTFCAGCRDIAIWITDDFEFKGSFFSRESSEPKYQLERDLRSPTLLKLGTLPKFTSKKFVEEALDLSDGTKEDCQPGSSCETHDHAESGVDSKEDSTSIHEQHPSELQASNDGISNNVSEPPKSEVPEPQEVEKPVQQAPPTVEVIRVSLPWQEELRPANMPPLTHFAPPLFQLNPMMGSQQWQAIQTVTANRKPLRLPPKPPTYHFEDPPFYRTPICIGQYDKPQQLQPY